MSKSKWYPRVVPDRIGCRCSDACSREALDSASCSKSKGIQALVSDRMQHNIACSFSWSSRASFMQHWCLCYLAIINYQSAFILDLIKRCSSFFLSWFSLPLAGQITLPIAVCSFCRKCWISACRSPCDINTFMSTSNSKSQLDFGLHRRRWILDRAPPPIRFFWWCEVE